MGPAAQLGAFKLFYTFVSALFSGDMAQITVPFVMIPLLIKFFRWIRNTGTGEISFEHPNDWLERKTEGEVLASPIKVVSERQQRQAQNKRIMERLNHYAGSSKQRRRR